MNSLEKFIIDNEKADITKLILAKNKTYTFDFDLAINTIQARASIKHKVKDWYNNTKLIYPSILSAQQCSSQESAEYKASICKSHNAHIIMDLCAGLGVDSFFLSKIADKVIYNEMNRAIFEAVQANFKTLSIENIICSNIEIRKDNLLSVLERYKPDFIFLDPARRDKSGKKLVLIEECSPNLIDIQDILLEHCNKVLVKLSPMADIAMIKNRCHNIEEIHIFSTKSECKEILVLMSRDKQKDTSLILKDDNYSISLRQEDIDNLSVSYIKDLKELNKYLYIFEASKSIIKSGLFNLPCSKLGLKKMAANTHLYLAEKDMNLKELANYGKLFKIIDFFPINKANSKLIKNKYCNAELTAKNIHMKSEELKKKLGLGSSSNLHIFACEIANPINNWKDKYYFICEKLSNLS